MRFVVITLIIYAVCMLLGFVYSWVSLYSQQARPYYIQQKDRRKEVVAKRMPLIWLNIVLVLSISGVGLFAISDWFAETGIRWWITVLEILFLMLMDDIFFYFYHRYLHVNPYLYRKIHRIHHKAIQPFPLEFLYVHPLEWMIGTGGIAVAVVILHTQGPISAWAFWIYGAYRNMHEIEIHSGIRSFIGQYIPFYGTVEHHDNHHAHVNGNYASTFTWLDRVCNTLLK